MAEDVLTDRIKDSGAATVEMRLSAILQEEVTISSEALWIVCACIPGTGCLREIST